MLATMATFYTEQQSVDVREGHARRVKNGFFVAKAPYGYRNIRVDGRGLVEVHPENGPKIERIFELCAFHGHTLDSLVDALEKEGITFTDATPRFSRSKVYEILKDRAYLGEVEYHEEWHIGRHQPLVDAMTWKRVQVLLGESVYQSHEMTYASELIKCARCGPPITGEVKTKRIILSVLCLNFSLEGATLVPTMRKPFDLMAEGLFSSDSRGDWI